MSAVLLCQHDVSAAERIAFEKSRNSAIKQSTGRREVVALVDAGKLQEQAEKSENAYLLTWVLLSGIDSNRRDALRTLKINF